MILPFFFCSITVLTLIDAHVFLDRLNVEVIVLMIIQGNNDESRKLCVFVPNLKVVELIRMEIENDNIENFLENASDESNFAALKHGLIFI